MDKFLAFSVLIVDPIEWVTDGRFVFLKRVILLAGEEDLVHLGLAVRTLFVLYLESLSQDAVPAAVRVSTFTDGVVFDVFTANETLVVLLLGRSFCRFWDIIFTAVLLVSEILFKCLFLLSGNLVFFPRCLFTFMVAMTASLRSLATFWRVLASFFHIRCVLRACPF